MFKYMDGKGKYGDCLSTYRWLILVTLLLITGWQLRPATHKVIEFEKISLERGLSQATVYDILHDTRGWMWFGTQDGLNRYDGYNFKIFRPEPEVANSISSHVIRALYEDGLGNLWVGTHHGLNRFDPFTETFQRFYHDPENPDSLSHDIINDICGDEDENLWIATPNGLNKFDRKSGRFIHFRQDLVKKDWLRSARINVLYKDPQHPGIIWVGTPYGLYRFQYRKGVFTLFEQNRTEPFSLNDNVILAIYKAPSEPGILWVGTASGGLNRLEEEKGRFTHYRNNPDNPDSLSSNSVQAIFEDLSGNLWIGTRGGGLNTMCSRRIHTTRYLANPRDPESLSNNLVTKIYGDRSGAVWVGTNGGGLSKHDILREKFIHFKHDSFDPNSLSNNYVFALYQDAAGQIWVGTFNGGLNRLNTSRDRFDRYINDPRDNGSLNNNMISAIAESRAQPGFLWIGTQGGGLNRLNVKTGRFYHYTHRFDDVNTLSSNMIRCIYEAPSEPGVLWIGTDGAGLNRFDIQKNQITRFYNNPNVSTSLSHNLVRTIYENRQGQLMVGTYGGGVSILDRANNTFRHLRHDPHNPESLSSDYIHCILEDSSGTMWIGSGGGGLNRFDQQAGNFSHFRMKEGLPNDVVYGILEDKSGNLWVSTNKGISRFNPKTEAFINYDIRDGLQSNEFNFGAYFKGLDGEMFFGGINGFNSFFPDKIRKNPFIPQIMITDFQIFNKSVVVDSSDHSPLHQHISLTNSIELSYWQNDVTFEFVALSYTVPEKNQYAYKLVGYDLDWIYSGSERTAHYTNLDPGDYLFMVKGANNDGVWNENARVIRLKIDPPIWRTWWAYLFYMLLMVLALWGIRRFELGRERARVRLRESELRALAAEAEARAIKAENERKSVELEEARNLQLSMLAKSIPIIPNLDIDVYMKTAAEVGGDYYDFDVNEDGTLTLAIGDATGHGMRAGTMVSVMKSLFWSDAANSNIQDFFRKSSTTIKKLKFWNLFMALTVAKIKDHECIISAAGMPPVYYYNAQNASVEKFVLKGPPLGSVPDFSYREKKLQLSAGDTLLFLTDGLPELFNEHDEMLEYKCIRKMFGEVAHKEPREIIDHLIEIGNRWKNGAPPEDDITFLVVKAK